MNLQFPKSSVEIAGNIVSLFPTFWHIFRIPAIFPKNEPEV
jgi:hypothetical protein